MAVDWGMGPAVGHAAACCLEAASPVAPDYNTRPSQKMRQERQRDIGGPIGLSGISQTIA